MSGYTEQVLVTLCLNIILAYGAFLPMAAGQVNLGVAGFLAIGAYAGAYASTELGVPALLAVWIGAGVAAVFAVIVGVVVLRTQGIYLALATFAFGQIVVATILNMEVVGGAAGYPVPDFLGFESIVWFAVGVTAVVILLWTTRFGMNIRAVHDDEAVADLFGLHVRGYQTAAFVLGAFLAGLGGGLWAHHYSYIEAQNFNILLSIYIVLYVLLGGTQTVLGPLVGATVFTLLPEALRGLDAWRYFIFAAVIIVMMVLRPQGAVTAETVRRLLRRRASAPEAAP